MIPVILAGGSGTRLWPLSRKQRPKQFLSIFEDFTLFQATLLRLEGFAQLQAPLIVCNEEHRFIVAEQLRQLDMGNSGILLEPFGRNTAPAIALAALQLMDKNPQETMLVLPSDHVIEDAEGFHAAIRIAQRSALQGNLVTFGVVPHSPETGYGYIHTGEVDTAVDLQGGLEQPPRLVKSFVEKPDRETATGYVESGEYLWNSGMFLFRVDTYLQELKKHQPDVYAYCLEAHQKVSTDFDFLRVNKEAFQQCEEISIDYAVMEHTQSAVVVPIDVGWNDVGAWSAVWDVGDKDSSGNVARGDVQMLEASNNLVLSESRLVSLLGVEDLIVVDSQDVTLVAHKDKTQGIKELVSQLKEQCRPEADQHRKVDRPWGAYDSIGNGNRFQVKLITVKPGAKLSLQKHFHRAEHWIVVTGTAEVTCNDKTFLLSENESTYIPLGSSHRLSNPGKVEVQLIEVQSGSYLEEDDIVRFDDAYGRDKV